MSLSSCSQGGYHDAIVRGLVNMLTSNPLTQMEISKNRQLRETWGDSSTQLSLQRKPKSHIPASATNETQHQRRLTTAVHMSVCSCWMEGSQKFGSSQGSFNQNEVKDRLFCVIEQADGILYQVRATRSAVVSMRPKCRSKFQKCDCSKSPFDVAMSW